ncbi:hypothetical protein GGR33_002473 [Methylobacterium brachythecii]|uniref:Uncharacterized protein n=1 Tax=Methylobacterium brachythecii TaxID=1176177 RepID=A0A7W6ALP8_9HYPH|nr:hypothetical protein [Methylobacterium brachythecii]
MSQTRTVSSRRSPLVRYAADALILAAGLALALPLILPFS